MVKSSTTESSSSFSQSVSPLQSLLIHLICGVGLAVGFWVAHNVYSINLISDPSRTLRLIWVIESPIVILLFSCFRNNPDKCSFVPAASVYGSSWEDWRRIFAHTKPNGSLDYMICLPAHGAVFGAWFGAWPMPLDWERPWQEWPICVSYGAVVGYLIATVASFGSVLIRGRQQHHKGD